MSPAIKAIAIKAVALMAAGYISPFNRRYNLLLKGRLALPTLATPFDGASPLLKILEIAYLDSLSHFFQTV